MQDILCINTTWTDLGGEDAIFAMRRAHQALGANNYLAAVVAYASGPVIKKYLGILAAADVYTASTTFAILESGRLDLGAGSQVHP